ncbi:MAG: hypothetical protein WDW36_003254 [Sanguina aurantia]
MSQFSYRAVSDSGELLQGQMEAGSVEDVIGRLQDQGHTLLAAQPADGAAGGGGIAGLFKRGPFTGDQLAQFTHQLATLLGAGQPLDRALSILLDLPEGEHAKKMIERVRDRVRGGTTLSQSLDEELGVFPKLYVSLVRAGEAGGSLEETLRRLADYLERAQALRGSIVNALIYPAFLMVGVLGSLVLLLAYVVPQFVPIFADMQSWLLLCAGEAPARPPLSSLDRWLEQPGTAVMLEAVLRHMGSSEVAVSCLRYEALTLIMHGSCMMERLQGCMTDPDGGVRVGTAGAITSLHVTLVKLLMLECREGRIVGGGEGRGFLAQMMLQTNVFTFSSSMRSVWVGLTGVEINARGKVVRYIYDSSSRGGSHGTGSSSGSGSSSSKFHSNDSRDGSLGVLSWLRLQLILVRSWVLVMSASRDDPDVQSSQELALALRGLCEQHGSGRVLETAFDACGLDLIENSKDRSDVPESRGPASHARWERFAFRHLRGRVLPGCSHWGCANISGFSEAALPTQLCGGCGRARYCSAECQRAAWVEGGHKEVCAQAVVGHL